MPVIYGNEQVTDESINVDDVLKRNHGQNFIVHDCHKMNDGGNTEIVE